MKRLPPCSTASSAAPTPSHRFKTSSLARTSSWEWEKKKQSIEERKKADIISQRVAYGIMEVKTND